MLRTFAWMRVATAQLLPQRLLRTDYGSLSVVLKYLAPHTSKGSRTTRVDPSHPCTLISIDPVVYLPGSNLGMCFHSSPFFLCSLCIIIPPARMRNCIWCRVRSSDQQTTSHSVNTSLPACNHLQEQSHFHQPTHADHGLPSLAPWKT